MSGPKIRMQPFKRECWAILAETDGGEVFARDAFLPVTQEFTVMLCDTEEHAHMAVQMREGKTIPPIGKYRVVPVVVTVEEVEIHKTPKATIG